MESIEENNLSKQLETLFPNSLFKINLSENTKIDEPITTEKYIILFDDRINKKYSDCIKCSEEKRLKYDYCMPIISNEDDSITIRQIINEMIDDYHYNSEEINEDDWTLVGFYKDKYKNNKFYAQFEN